MAFYEENAEIKIIASRKILILTLDMKNIEYLINHGFFILFRFIDRDYM